MRIILVTSILLTAISICAFSIDRVNRSTKIAMMAIEDSLEKDRLKFMNEVMASIKGKEKWRADSVFKNIKVIVGESSVSAEHLLWMMNWGWSKELGVSCSHCHTKGNWESDSLPAKNIARGMWTMRVKINKELLPSITGLDYEKNPKVSCITCHRGKPVPDAF
ncbi:MAG TPA: c-type cytochrome [Chitinophagaceae bacterium]|nr:c-type cytochrome [Chitinophagaceae bacterium]